MALNFFYGVQADRYSFIPIPKTLMTEKMFSGMQSWAKITYGFLLDRMKQASGNQWIDEDGLVYVVYPLDEIRKDMGISRKQAKDYMAELEDVGLLERKSPGRGLPDRLYLKRINIEQ